MRIRALDLGTRGLRSLIGWMNLSFKFAQLACVIDGMFRRDTALLADLVRIGEHTESSA